MDRWNPTGTPHRCLTCGAHVAPEFRRGYGDERDRAHRCTECDNFGRLADGSAAGKDVDGVDPLDQPERFGGAFKDLSPTVRALCKGVATDGGATVDGLAEELGKHPATIYRAIQDLGEIVDLDQGQVSYRVRKYREEIRALAESAEYAIESYADRLQHVMGLADHVAECSPFQRWLAENGADLEFDESGEPRQLRIDTVLSMLKSDSFEHAATLATEALRKWSRSGNDPTALRGRECSGRPRRVRPNEGSSGRSPTGSAVHVSGNTILAPVHGNLTFIWRR